MEIVCLNIEDATAENYTRLYRMASQERRNRADRCRLPADSIRCVASDALLRFCLGSHVLPELAFGQNGKPYVKNRSGFYYNLSHSGSWAVIGTAGSEIGIDVEMIRWDDGKEKIADRYFAPAEQEFLRSAPDDETGADRFAVLWTGKESYLKYLGTGLTKSLRSFSIRDGIVEDPIGTPIGSIHIRTVRLDERHCLSVCCGETAFDLRKLTVSQLLDEFEKNEPPA